MRMGTGIYCTSRIRALVFDAYGMFYDKVFGITSPEFAAVATETGFDVRRAARLCGRARSRPDYVVSALTDFAKASVTDSL